MSEFQMNGMVKGVSSFEGKKGTYHSVELFFPGQNPCDLKADVDMQNGGKALHEFAVKNSGAQVACVLDLTFYGRNARFKLVSMKPIQQK